jgi:citrate lyase subunit beta/citryl-CoA lyase
VSGPVSLAGLNGAVTTASAVTALFVPGDRPERFSKAAASGADVVIIDLEDAVAEDSKSKALAAAVAALTPNGEHGTAAVRALVRTNPAGSATHDEEIHTLLSLAALPGHGLLGVVVPKAEDVSLLHALARTLPHELAFVPLIESALGAVHALEIASIDAVTRLAFGAIDFALDIDADGGDRFLDHARAQLVLVSRAAGVAAPLDSPSVEIKDVAMLVESARTARNFGFGGKLCIHPAQLAPVAGAFTPTEAEIRWAESVVGAEGAAAQIAGQMVDRPVIERAKKILTRAGLEL